MPMMVHALFVVALSVICLHAGLVCGHPFYRNRIPNALHITGYESIGHMNPRGGGPLNVFGEAFVREDRTWTRALCQMDSDGDGEHNGQELGDPCCVWTKESGLPPRREWQLSHPADPLSISGAAAVNCSDDTQAISNEPGVVRNAGDAEQFNDWYFTARSAGLEKVREDFFNDYIAPLTNITQWISWISQPQDHTFTRNTRNISSVILLLFAVVAIIRLARNPRAISLTSWVMLFFASCLWSDAASGFLHIVLDNPLMNGLPIIGPEAVSFQGHHDAPTDICLGAWSTFLRDHHPAIVLFTAVVVLQWRRLHLWAFFLLANIQLTVMMAAHRFAHMMASEVPEPFRTMQQYHLLIDQDHHSRHHVSFDNNFAIFTGWTNPALNLVVRVLHHERMEWLFVLLAWGFLPTIISIVHSIRSEPSVKTKSFKVE